MGLRVSHPEDLRRAMFYQRVCNHLARRWDFEPPVPDCP